MPSADLTRRELTFGAHDSVTGWFAKNYAETTIKGSIQPQGASMSFLPCGSYAKYPNTLFTEYIVHEGDQIVDADLDVYELNTVVKWSWLDMFSHRQCEAVKKQFPNRDATSGTWHLDSDSLTTDVRSRTKKYFETYTLTISGNYILMFDGADYPIKYLFNPDLGIDTDLVVTFSEDTLSPFIDYLNRVYAFLEPCIIKLYAVNKSGVTAPNIIEQAEQEIRRITTAHPTVVGISIRSIQASTPSKENLGDNSYLWCKTVTLRYKRVNGNFTSTDTLTWGSSGSSGTFTFPNIKTYRNPFTGRDSFTDMPGRQGDYPFLLGGKSDLITLTCDLDSGDWLRPQGSSSKTDSVPWQVFKDIVVNGGINQVAQVLSVAGETHAVRLHGELELSAGNHTATLYFTEYNSTPANTNYKTRHGIA